MVVVAPGTQPTSAPDLDLPLSGPDPEQPNQLPSPAAVSDHDATAGEGGDSPSEPPPSPDGLTIEVLRELFRRLVLWRTIYESDGVEIITLPDGHTEISIHEVEYLLALTEILPLRHRQAIYLCLVWNYSEEEAAAAIHIDISNPVAQYATDGLRQLLSAVRLGLVPSMRQMHVRQAVKAHRSDKQRTAGSVDFGPGVPMIYQSYQIFLPPSPSAQEDADDLSSSS